MCWISYLNCLFIIMSSRSYSPRGRSPRHHSPSPYRRSPSPRHRSPSPYRRSPSPLRRSYSRSPGRREELPYANGYIWLLNHLSLYTGFCEIDLELCILWNDNNEIRILYSIDCKILVTAITFHYLYAVTEWRSATEAGVKWPTLVWCWWCWG